MSYSIVGNDRNPTDFLTWHEVEIDDDEYEDIAPGNLSAAVWLYGKS